MKTLRANYLGSFTLESCLKITVKDLFYQIEQKLRNEILNIELDWIELIETKANLWWVRYWFKCPDCYNKSFILYKSPITNNLCCRKCSGLKYKKQRYKWMIEEKMINKFGNK